jgi:hypothetical protein
LTMSQEPSVGSSSHVCKISGLVKWTWRISKGFLSLPKIQAAYILAIQEGSPWFC